MKMTIISFILVVILLPAGLSAQSATPDPVPPLAVLGVSYEKLNMFGCSRATLVMTPPGEESSLEDQYLFTPGTKVYLQGIGYPPSGCGTMYAVFDSISGVDVVYDPGGSPDGDYYIIMDGDKEITVSYWCVESTLCPTDPPPSPTPTTGSGSQLGDVDWDGDIDIIDALLTAQSFVGLNPPRFNEAPADVDCDGDIDIVDALLIAQYYVGMIPGFSCP
jgi:hypothetical protein